VAFFIWVPAGICLRTSAPKDPQDLLRLPEPLEATVKNGGFFNFYAEHRSMPFAVFPYSFAQTVSLLLSPSVSWL
jgi:hypothetical protein